MVPGSKPRNHGEFSALVLGVGIEKLPLLLPWKAALLGSALSHPCGVSTSCPAECCLLQPCPVPQPTPPPHLPHYLGQRLSSTMGGGKESKSQHRVFYVDVIGCLQQKTHPACALVSSLSHLAAHTRSEQEEEEKEGLLCVGGINTASLEAGLSQPEEHDVSSQYLSQPGL